MQEIPVLFLGREDPLEKGTVTHSNILGLPLWLSWYRICLQCRRPGFDPCVGKIPWRRERQPISGFLPGELWQSMGSHRVGHCAVKQLSSSSSYIYKTVRASLMAQLVKNLPAMQEPLVWFLGREGPLEKELATYSNILGLPLWLSW